MSRKSNFDVNVDGRTDGRTEIWTPISHLAISRCDKKLQMTSALKVDDTRERKIFFTDLQRLLRPHSQSETRISPPLSVSGKQLPSWGHDRSEKNSLYSLQQVYE